MLVAEVDRDEMLVDLLARVEDTYRLRRLLGDLLVDYEKKVFATGGLGRWANDDPATVRAKQSGRVLVDTGGLLDALTSPIVDGVDSVRVDAGGADYAQYLLRGARGAPPRNPAPAPSASQVDSWAEQILGYLVTGRRR